jgi:hypothetical protein
MKIYTVYSTSFIGDPDDNFMFQQDSVLRSYSNKDAAEAFLQALYEELCSQEQNDPEWARYNNIRITHDDMQGTAIAHDGGNPLAPEKTKIYIVEEEVYDSFQKEHVKEL